MSNADGTKTVRYIATFTPQAWVGDYAQNVDPEGETTWDVTDYLMSMPAHERSAALVEDSYESDQLRMAPNTPEWIKAWSGPFYISVEEVAKTAEEIAAEMKRELSEDLKTAKAQVFSALRMAGVKNVFVKYDGYGDEGQIEAIDAFNGKSEVTLEKHVRDAIEEMCIDILAMEDIDWKNGLGGAGEFVLDVDKEMITLDHAERVEELHSDPTRVYGP